MMTMTMPTESNEFQQQFNNLTQKDIFNLVQQKFRQDKIIKQDAERRKLAYEKHKNTQKFKTNNKKRALKGYYIKHDLYHPELNPVGSIERKYKRDKK